MIRKFYSIYRALVRVAMFSLSIVAWLASSHPAASDDETGRGGFVRPWAVLIGAEKYHRANQLKYTVNDVRELSLTLQRRGGYSAERVLEMTDDALNPRFQPLRASLMAELPRLFERVEPGDSLVVYFSGHGFRDAAGKLYLAPLDCDPADPTASGVPVEWLREQIASCRAAFKLLVLDACHAGSEKGDDDDAEASVAAKDLGDLFRNLEGVVTIASSTADEKSQLWDDKQHSLFSYWLNQGLKGHADENSDGAVDIDELYKFVYRNVTNTAKAQFPLPQTPVRIVRSGTPDVPVVVRLRPQTLREILSDIAEQLADKINERRLEKVGVLEFTNDTRLGELLGADFGLLGRYCSEELERRLMNAGDGRFSVVDRRRLQSALKSQNFAIDDLGSGEQMKQLSTRVGGMPAVALGTLRNRTGRVITLQCKLVSVDTDELVGAAAGSALLNESEWAMLGRSVQIEPEDRRPRLVEAVEAVPVSTTVIERADERSRGPHPLQDPSFEYPIKIMIGGQERPFTFRRIGEGEDEYTECLVPVRMGEVYEIWILNRTSQPVMMRLLVDGLNTLTEKEDVKGVETIVWGKRVSLDDAKPWLLDPYAPGVTKIKGLPTWAVRGFVTESGPRGKLRQFTVVDAIQSLAARQQFTDQIGLITAAFYTTAGGSRAVGTAAGDERTEEIRKRSEKIGNLLSVVHIRYVEEDALGSGAGS
jgi:uncharacterized caspase-like protein